MSPYSYIRSIFRASSAKAGGVVRRSVAEVHRCASFQALSIEVRSRGFHLLEAGDQYIVICTPNSCKLHF